MKEEVIRKILREEISAYFSQVHPCKKCNGYVPDGAIICMHCGKTDP